MKYKALSIVAPAGDKIAAGVKTIEVRSWQPPSVPLTNVLIVQNKNFLREDGQEDENGLIVAIVDFVAVRPWVKEEFVAACASSFAEGYYGWHIKNVRKLKAPVKAVAKRKIYDLELSEEDAAELVRACQCCQTKKAD